MSTYSLIGHATPTGCDGVGVYTHAAPPELGPTLWADLHGTFGGGRAAWVQARITAHPQGWLDFPTRCACHSSASRSLRTCPRVRRGSTSCRCSGRCWRSCA